MYFAAAILAPLINRVLSVSRMRVLLSRQSRYMRYYITFQTFCQVKTGNFFFRGIFLMKPPLLG